ncbi:uncharacterized protein TNCV_4940481 [Trichonephila clavipes]|nr:uncharacterized protein TNCV_4940481 [Trichonephila clavipes]
MELLVVATSMLRLFLVSVVYLLNIRGLLRLTWQPRACIHALTTGAVLLAGVLYLSSWAPYIAYTLANGHWLLLGARRHCLLQHFVAAEIGAVLLALLAVRLMYRLLVKVYKRPPPSARAASLVTCLAWLGPQLLYDAVAVTRDDTTRSPDSYRFLDDLLVVPQGSNASHGYRVGFMICMQLLSGPVLSYYVWQYLVLVLPLAGVIIYCSARLMLASHIRRREEPADSSIESRSGRFVCHTQVARGRQNPVDTAYDVGSVVSVLADSGQSSPYGFLMALDVGRRFVEWAQNEIAVVPDFHKRILFSDEAHFWLNGYVNKQNCRIWSEVNPQVYVETPLHPEKLTVWCALWAGGILLQKR